MKTKVREILERELRKLDELSVTTGLDLNDFKRLDLLIKAYQTFAPEHTNLPPSPDSVASRPSQQIIEAMLNPSDDTNN